MNIDMRVRHVIVAVAVLVVGGLTGLGCIGPAVGDERISAYDVTAVVREDRSIAIREVIDYDFGGADRHGIFRTIPTAGGAPEQVEVSSPTAPDQFTMSSLGPEVEIKIGDPDETISGRHRYVIEYVLDGSVVADRLALNVIGTEWPVPIRRAEARIIGARLDGARCFRGPYGSTATCDVETDASGATTIREEDLDDHEGVTVDGTITAIEPAAFNEALPPFEDRDEGARVVWAAIALGLGAVTALVVFVVCRQLGRNEVAGGGATEAAFVDYGSETFGTHHDLPGSTPPRVEGSRMVADTKMAELAGLEFVPPGGVEPWQASVVLRETIDDRTVGAWFASLAAHDILTIDKEGEKVVLRPGPQAAAADATTAPILNSLFAGRAEVRLGSYQPAFATAWKEAGTSVSIWTTASHTFRRRPPTYGSSGAGAVGCVAVFGAMPVLFVGGGIVAALGGSGLARTAFAGIALALLVPGLVAYLAYRRLTRSLSAKGSAIALRTESFRRFLHDSEAQHVEWAWQHGLLREYSAWAVALGEVQAWNGAMARSSVPPAEVHSSSYVMAPALYASSFSSTTTAPSSSGSSGGGSSGFSGGGFSGGGGGGGGGGSW